MTKQCPWCGTWFGRKRYASGRWEAPGALARRVTCGAAPCYSQQKAKEMTGLRRGIDRARVEWQHGRIEDIRDLLEMGESPSQIVARIAPLYGDRPVKATSLARWLHRRGEHEMARHFENSAVDGYRWGTHRQRVAA